MADAREVPRANSAETRKPPLIRREAMWLAAIVVGIAAATILVARLRFGNDFLTESDAGIFLRIARDPFGHGATLLDLPAGTGLAYRYGRILYPLVAWLLAGGSRSLVVWTLPIVYLFGLGLLTATAAELAARRGARPLAGLLVLAAPAFWLTFPVLFPDPFVVSLILLTFLSWLDGRPLWTYVAASLALLARESSVLAVLPLIWTTIRRDGARAAAPWLAVFVPLIGWWVWVRAQFGYWPFTDPAYGRRGALAAPLDGVVRAIQEGKLSRPLFVFALVLMAITIAAATWAWRARPWPPITDAALLFSFLLFFLGPGAMRLPGAAIRLMLPAQVLILLALVRRKEKESIQNTLAKGADDHGPGSRMPLG